MKKLFLALVCPVGLLLLSCDNANTPAHSSVADRRAAAVDTGSPVANPLPPPYATKSVRNFSKVIGWPPEKTPIAPAGFTVSKFANGLINPRCIYVAPNGDIFIAEANTEPKGFKKVAATVSGKAKSQNLGRSANRITLFRDADKDGIPETRTVFMQGLNQPFGMLILNNHFYVAATDGLWQFPYTTGATKLPATGKKIVSLPAGGYNNHWTRNIISNKKEDKIYISVGSASNNGEYGMENEIRRAAILEVNPDGSGEKIYAGGLRNPVGMDWAPGTETLWTVVNERDHLGDELVPDYLTSVKEGGFYGWPYAYFGQHEDPRMKDKQRPDLVKKTIVPDVSLGAHTAALGLVFYDATAFPAKYHNGAFVALHGSWNRLVLSGYKVVFVPFSNGKPSGNPEDFLTGFIANLDESEVYGRPVSVAVLADGSLLVSDDASNKIWRVSVSK